jgi:hypothetical protein
MTGSPDAGILCRMFPFGDESPSAPAPTRGGGALATLASEFVDGMLPPVEFPRFNCGGPSSSASRGADGADGRDTGLDVAAESPEVVCALGEPPELPVARCSLGRSGSSSLIEEPIEEPLEALLDEFPVGLSGLAAARRNAELLLSLPLGEPDADLLEELPVESLDKGRDVSFIACEAAACSSVVPSLTIVIVEAWLTLWLSRSALIRT